MDGVLLHVRVTPRAHKNEIRGLHGDRLKVYLQSPPVDGKANQMLVKFLGKQFGVPAGRVELLRGEKSREKTIFIAGLSVEKAAEQIGTP